MKRNVVTCWFACGLLGAALLAGAAACGDSGGEGGGPSGGDGFNLEYEAGAESLLDLRVTASLGFSGENPTIPALSSVAVAEAHAIVLGNGQQVIDLALSSVEGLEGDRFELRLEFSRANDGEVIDGGGTLEMSCGFDWFGADGSSFNLPASCDVRRSGSGYEVTIVETYLDNTQASGSVTFGPVPNEPDAFTPGYGCAEDQICLSLDPSQFDPETGFCMPATNLKSYAAPCIADCGEQLVIEVGGEETCICTAACGRVDAGGGGDLPICDPAYGCIDI